MDLKLSSDHIYAFCLYFESRHESKSVLHRIATGDENGFILKI